MSKSIYNIEQELNNIFIQIENADGEITDDLQNQLIISQTELQNKGIQYGYKCMSLDAEIKQIDDEIERLSMIKSRNVKLKERLKETLKNAMINYGIDEIKTPTLKINFRKSESVEIENEELINKEFIREKISYTISKTDIKKALKDGKSVLGAKLVVNDNLQIK